MRLAFLGTPAFAVPTLERLVARGHAVAAVITQPDRPKGRGQTLAPPPVKVAALRLGLPVYQPERIKRPEAVEYLRSLAPEAMVVVGYGQIIPQSILDIPPLGILNVHASLLPKYRGAGPIQWAIVNGETVTGVTIMRIDAGLDTGPDAAQSRDRHRRRRRARSNWAGACRRWARICWSKRSIRARDASLPQPQDNARSSYAPMLKKEDGRIDWRRSAQAIHNQVRGMQPWPGAYSTFRGAALHVWRARPVEVAGGVPGTLASVKPLRVACGAGALELVEVQMEGRKRMPGADFANGHRLIENEMLGELPV
jgi:methionyl-tRNA formyltransferase